MPVLDSEGLPVISDNAKRYKQLHDDAVRGHHATVFGGIGGGYIGNRASNWVTNKLGLTDDKGGWRKWLGRGLRTAGTVGGAAAGVYGGGWAGARLGSNVGEWFDPQQGKAIQVSAR